MNDDCVVVKIPILGYEYMLSSGLLQSIPSFAASSTTLSGKWAAVELSRCDVDPLRESLVDQIAQSGFDENYELNAKGRILEDIVDSLPLA